MVVKKKNKSLIKKNHTKKLSTTKKNLRHY